MWKVLLHHAIGAIPAAIINDDDLVVRIALAADRSQTLNQCVFAIVGWDHDRYQQVCGPRSLRFYRAGRARTFRWIIGFIPGSCCRR